MPVDKKILIPIGVILLGILIILEREQIKKYIIFPIKYRKIKDWFPFIKESSDKYGIDPAFVSAIMYQESRGNPQALSSKGAIGLMQIMPSTGLSECKLSKENLRIPQFNIGCGTKYLADMYKRFKDYKWIAAGYYGGAGTAPTATKGFPPVYQYVKEVMGHYKNIKEYIRT